jgi:predicted DCC family thiol-disulfide oxidoreductase YuxK
LPHATRHTPHATRHTPHATRDAGLRDAIYKFVARNRIWLFGAVETCRRATKQDKKHFL